MLKLKIELGNKPLKDGTYALYIRLTQNRKLKRSSLGISVEKHYYNPKATSDSKNWIRAGHPSNSNLNNYILDKLNIARDAVVELKSNATKETVVRKLKEIGSGTLAHSFLTYADCYVESFNNKEYNTYRGKKSSLNKFKEFLLSKGYKDLVFSEVTLQIIKEYDLYLNNSGIRHNTVEKELARLRAIIREAVKDDEMPIERDPFRKFPLQRKKSEKVRLIQSEIDKLASVELPVNSLSWNVRNAYLFSFYGAGIRCGDLLSLRWKNVQNGRICYQMNKTGHVIQIKLSKEANGILDLYKDQQQDSNIIFPFFKNDVDYADNWFLKKEISRKNALINKYLKQIAIKAGIEKTISMHTARHSFANLSCQKTRDVRAVSLALGHKTIRVTQNYLDSFDTNAVDNIIDLMFD